MILSFLLEHGFSQQLDRPMIWPAMKLPFGAEAQISLLRRFRPD